MLPFFQALESTGVGNVIRQSIWMFPLIQCFHLLGLALLGGTVLAVDMRMLGLGLIEQSSADLVRKLRPWMTGALVVTILSGILMFLSEAVKCYYSPPFWYKMTCLAFAVVFSYTLRNKVAMAQPGSMTRLTAAVSMLLWLGVGFSGRWIAFY